MVERAGTPRSYIVETPNGQLRRNRRQLNLLPGTPEADYKADSTAASPSSAIISSLEDRPQFDLESFDP